MTHGMIQRRRALWLAGLALLAACAGTPDSAPGSAPADVRQALAPTGTLRIAAYPGSPTSLVPGAPPGQERGVAVALGSSSRAALSRDLKAAQVVPVASTNVAAEMLRKGELDLFASNKGILFDMADRVPGSRVLDGRWALEQLAIGVPKGREVAAAWLQGFVADPATQTLVRAAAQRAGLRGLAAAP